MKYANSPFLQLPLSCWLLPSLSPRPLSSSARLNRVAKPKGTRPCWQGTVRSVLRKAWVHHSSLPALGQRLPSVAGSEPAKPRPGMQASTAGEPRAGWRSGATALREPSAAAPQRTLSPRHKKSAPKKTLRSYV